MNADKLNRPSANPGGMECQTCGRIFIGDESHSECGLCHNTRPTAVASHAEDEAARRFHEAYERLAPSFGYETRKETREFDPTSPNGRLMIAVCNEVMYHPPRSGDEARDAARYRWLLANRFYLADNPHTQHYHKAGIDTGWMIVQDMSRAGLSSAIDAAMAKASEGYDTCGQSR